MGSGLNWKGWGHYKDSPCLGGRFLAVQRGSIVGLRGLGEDR